MPRIEIWTERRKYCVRWYLHYQVRSDCQLLITRLVQKPVVNLLNKHSINQWISQKLTRTTVFSGFSDPLMACCGAGGRPYNYDIRVTCGQPGYQVCNENSKFISWDGIHYSEEANKIVASKVLSRAYSTPSLPFDFFCNNWVQLNHSLFLVIVPFSWIFFFNNEWNRR